MTTGNFLHSIDNHCGTTNNMTALSVFSCASTVLIMFPTIFLNSVIIYCLIKEHRQKYKSFFYKLLLNIAMADLLTGLITEPTSANALRKEALNLEIGTDEVYIIHTSMFFTDAVALLTLTLLSIDRVIAVVFPIKHHNGMPNSRENLLVFSVWPLAMLLILPYFKVKFIRQLLIFSSTNIAVAVLALIVTTITYRKKLGAKHTNNVANIRNEKCISLNLPMHSLKKAAMLNKSPLPNEPQQSQLENSNKEKLKDNKQGHCQQRATRTFILMLYVFVTTYFPTTVTMVYMNSCRECDCNTVHAMRDLSITFILSSSIVRPLNFILTLKHLRGSAFKVFERKKRATRELAPHLENIL